VFYVLGGTVEFLLGERLLTVTAVDLS